MHSRKLNMRLYHRWGTVRQCVFLLKQFLCVCVQFYCVCVSFLAFQRIVIRKRSQIRLSSPANHTEKKYLITCHVSIISLKIRLLTNSKFWTDLIIVTHLLFYYVVKRSLHRKIWNRKLKPCINILMWDCCELTLKMDALNSQKK